MALLVLVVVAEDENDDVKLANAIVDWVRAEGGYFSSKLEIGRASPVGVFASQDIQAQEQLFIIPHSCFIALWDTAAPVDANDEEDEAYNENLCHLAQKLAEELELGKDSVYAPYVDYVKNQKQGQIPATWSDEGKQVLRQILADESRDVVDWIEMYQKGCNVDKHMLALTSSRGYDTAFIPIWDLVNHHNGKGRNVVNDPIYDHDALKVRASKDIQKGEEVFTSYNDAVDFRMWKSFCTVEILKDLGFVEPYPTRWIFEDEAEIWFEIDKGDDDELEIEWDTGKDGYGVPDEEGISFLKDGLKRLQAFDSKEQGQVPEYEWNIILQYHEAATTAISKAIQAAIVYNEEAEGGKEEL